MNLTLRGCQPPAKRSGMAVTLTFSPSKKTKNNKKNTRRDSRHDIENIKTG